MKTFEIIKKVFKGGAPFSLDQVLEAIDAYERYVPALNDLNDVMRKLISEEGLLQFSSNTFRFGSDVQTTGGFIEIDEIEYKAALNRNMTRFRERLEKEGKTAAVDEILGKPIPHDFLKNT